MRLLDLTGHLQYLRSTLPVTQTPARVSSGQWGHPILLLLTCSEGHFAAWWFGERVWGLQLHLCARGVGALVQTKLLLAGLGSGTGTS